MIIISKGTNTVNTTFWNNTLYIALLLNQVSLNKRHRYKVQFIYDIRRDVTIDYEKLYTYRLFTQSEKIRDLIFRIMSLICRFDDFDLK